MVLVNILYAHVHKIFILIVTHSESTSFFYLYGNLFHKLKIIIILFVSEQNAELFEIHSSFPSNKFSNQQLRLSIVCDSRWQTPASDPASLLQV